MREYELSPGKMLEVRKVGAEDSVVTVEDEWNSHRLGHPLADSILVRHLPNHVA